MFYLNRFAHNLLTGPTCKPASLEHITFNHMLDFGPMAQALAPLATHPMSTPRPLGYIVALS
uniref:Uncharacterized protein n=1 Tax=Cucumis melo TaxID=3656 RepID=A0A9I9EL63_CUCME